MRTFRLSLGALTATGALLAGLPMCARDTSTEPQQPLTPASVTPAATVPAVTTVVTSRDAEGRARFVWGTGAQNAAPIALNAEGAARAYLASQAATLGLSDGIVRAAHVEQTHAIPGGGSVVQFGQKVDGIEVFRTRASVVLDPNKQLIAISGNLAPHAAVKAAKAGAFAVSPEQAFANAYADRYGVKLAGGAVNDVGADNGDYRAYKLTAPQGAPRLIEAGRAKKIYFPEAGKLVPAYYAEFIAREAGSTDNDGWSYAVSAVDGRVLYKASITANETFNYRVWADGTPDHIPSDGPMVDYTPHPTGTPDKVIPGYAAPILVSMEGFNKNPNGKADPWLPATATVTTGNNVDAYTDRDNYTNDAGVLTNDGYTPGDDYRADTTGTRTFDRVFDVTKAPNASVDQMKAAVTQIFYTTNWLHDYWYDSGFNEAAGVAQTDNFGRGGVGGDPLQAQAQDGADYGQANNANMSTPADGKSPKMQMYVWTGLPNRTLTTNPAITFDDGLGAAAFGPQTFNLAATAVLVNDGGGTSPTDACEAPTNVTGKIAVLDRGNCNFTVKAENAQAAGAVGIIIINNAAGHTPVSPGVADPNVTIPLLGLSLEDGAKLKQALAAGTVTATLKRGDEVLHDGTIDNTVVGHEWGHYLHHRLVQCGLSSCAGMSEGWADFDAVMLVIKEADTLDNSVFPMAQYASAGLNAQSAYFGIRRAPYSTDFAKNPFTFKHIRKSGTLPTGAPLAAAAADLSEAHNVGEIWTETLFEAYVNLLKDSKGATPRFTFQQAKRRMADYVVAGMKAAPVEPTFTEQRDAMLAAVFARDKADFAAITKGFAKRGLGVAAVAPPVTSTTLDEAVEDFHSGGNIQFISATIDDSIKSCDNDGYLDAGESGHLTIKIRNGGWAQLTKTKVTVTTTLPGITFENNGVADAAATDPFGTTTVTLKISADGSATSKAYLPISISVNDPDSAVPTATGKIEPLFNFDEVPASSKNDDVEANKSPWTFGHGATPVDVWGRVLSDTDPHNHFFHADDPNAAADESLVSPDLVVSATDKLTIGFSHRFSFENGPVTSGGAAVYFDGGVVEVSTDGGATWKDISTYVDPGYTQTLYSAGAGKDTNVLAGKKAYGGASAGYPAFADVALDLGTQLAGKTIKLRFRVGSDESGSDAGWDIDNLKFTGITNTPFPTVVDDKSVCAAPPADAGTDGGNTDGGPVNPGTDGGTDSGTSVDSGTGTDSGTDTDSGTETDASTGSDSGTGTTDAGKPDSGTPTGNGGGDDGCSCSEAVGHSTGNAWSAALLGGLALLVGKRRRSRR